MQHLRRSFRTFAAVAVVLAVSATWVGCGSSGSSSGGSGSSTGTTTSSGSKDRGTIGLAQALNSGAFSIGMTKLVEKYAKEAGFDTVFATADGDSSKQVSDIQSMLSRNVKGLIVWPVDSNASVPIINNAVDQGVPVVTPNFGSNSPKTYMNVDPDQQRMGEEQCEQTGKALNGKGELFYLAGNLNDLLGSGRWKGFKQCMTAKFPDIAVTMKEAKWDGAAGANLVQTAFTAKDYDALVLASDTVFLSGVESVLKQMGKLKPAGDPGHIYMIAIDGGPEAVQAIRAGTLDATIVQPLDLASKLTVQYLIDALDGKPRPKLGPTDHDSTIVKNDHGAWFDRVPGFVATKDSVDDPKVWGNSYQGEG